MGPQQRTVQLLALGASIVLATAACSGGAEDQGQDVNASLAEVRQLAFEAAEAAESAEATAERALEVAEEATAAGDGEAPADGQNAGDPAADGEGHETTTGDDPAAGIDETQTHGGEVHWSYEGETGPDRWAEVSAEFAACETGLEQSPIDLATGLVPVGLDDLQVDWKPSELTVVDNGHTIQANVAPGSTTIIDGKPYDLVQFHFHKPSEHTVATEVFPLELHFVHADAAGTLAVVGVLLEVGEANPSYDVLWDAQTPGGESTVADFDLTTLLPGNLRRYRYAGSLTTPPCTEGVNWNVVAEPASLSQAQLDGFLYDGNARPVQELGSRTVLADQS